MQLLNRQTGKTESLEKGDALAAIAAGTHTPVGGNVVIGPDGKPGVVAKDDLPDVLGGGAGYQIPTQPQLDELAKQAKYGDGTANELKAFGAGAARGATFGVSDAVLPALGVTSQEALREREARNPASSITGELAGMAGSAMLLPGGGAVGAVGKLGDAVAEGLAPRALGEGASLASRILQGAGQVGAKALGSAVEGAAFGAGQSVSEAALGDPDLTAQKVLGNIGLGALWGGALGGLMKVGELTVPPAVGKARDAAKGAWRTLFGGEIPTGEAHVVDMPTPPGTEPAAAVQATGTDGPAAGLPLEPAGDAAPPEEPAGPFDRRSGPRAYGGNAAEQIPMAPTTGPSTEWNDGIIPKLIARGKEVLGGPSAEETLEQFRNRAGPTTGEILNPKEFDGFVRDSVKSLQDTYDSMDEASRAASGFARPGETRTLLAGADTGAAQAESQRIAQRLDQVATEMERRPELFPARYPSKLQEIASGFSDKVFHAESAADHFAAIDEVKGLLQKLSKFEKGSMPTAADSDALQAVRGLSGEIRRSLENEETWGAAGARQAAYNRATSDYLDSAKEFRRRFMTKQVMRGRDVWKVDPTKVKTYFNAINDARGEFRSGVIDEWLRAGHDLTGEMEKTHQVSQIRDFDPEAFKTKLGANRGSLDRARNVVSGQPGQGYGFFTSLFLGHALGGPMATVATVAKGLTDPVKLAAMERAAGKTTNAVAKGAKALFRQVEAGATKGAGILAEKLTPAEKLERFEKRVEEIQTRAGSPEAMVDELDKATQPSFDVAPKITQSLQMAAIRGTQFLASKIPQPPPQMPLDRKFQPTTAQVASFDRYYDAVHDPLTVMEQLKSGRVHPETVEAVGAVYPELMAEMRQEVLSELTGRIGSENVKLSYQQKLALGQFLGQPLSTSATPAAVAANQMAMGSAQSQARQEQQQAGVKPSQAGLGKLDLADRTRTSQQDASSRERA